MIDTAAVYNSPTTSTDTKGFKTPAYGDPIYSGKYRLQSTEPFASKPGLPGKVATIQQMYAHFPVGAFTPAIGQHVKCLTSKLDARLVGRRFRIVALPEKTGATAMRLQVEEVTG